MSFRWSFIKPVKQDIIPELSKKLGLSRDFGRLLAARNIHTFDEAELFFRPDVDSLLDPFLMKDMEKASLRLSRAVRGQERVLVYGDYDVDGTTATTILLLFLREFGVDAHYFIPHRFFKEGDGIHPEGIRRAKKIGADLMVTVDCGITAFNAARQALDSGIDLIICDHHTAGDRIPEAVAVLDPKRADCGYPFDGLSGAGVGFKLIQATLCKLGLPEKMAYQYLDLVAISIASDIVPIVNENRVMMRRGLEMINSSPRPGIKALLELIHAENATISTSTIIHSIGPRINAAGRMGDPKSAVELMISEEGGESCRCAAELELINKSRRRTDSRTMNEALAKIDREFDVSTMSSMVLHDPDWHLGVIGIVASRLVDVYCRPVFMLSSEGGKIQGSARSVKGFNIYEALKKCEDLLDQFGGHKYAAGLTMNPDNLARFRDRMDEITRTALTDRDFSPELTVDLQLDLSDVDRKFWKSLSRFEPFGPGNTRPVFVSEDVEISGMPAIVGNGHLKLRLKQNGSEEFEAIGFNMHKYMPLVRDRNEKRIDIAYEIEENYWNNRRTLQLRLKDIHIKNRVRSEAACTITGSD